MKKITIAFDVDGTLIRHKEETSPHFFPDENDRITDLLKILSSFKNTKIIVWSWQWEEWAKLIIKELMLEKYVDWYASKNHKGKDKDWKHIFEPEIKPDIAIDDIQACELWLLNLIVREK